jgi:DNA-binding GntR family transcriptional regulator
VLQKLIIQNYPTIREQVYDHIRRAILSGEIASDERLVEGKLSEELGTSRTPIREALHKLEMEKLVRPIPRVGYVVREITEEEIEEICEIRAALETLAAKWASTKITPKELARLERIVLMTDKHIERNETQVVVDLDTEFHDILCRAGKSRRLEEISQSLRDHMLKFRIKGLCFPEIARRSNEGHRHILQAIKSKNRKKIESAVRFHLGRTKDDVTKLFRSSA